jgi:hypothetical protein
LKHYYEETSKNKEIKVEEYTKETLEQTAHVLSVLQNED